MREATLLRTGVKRSDGVRRERAKTHGRNIETRGAVRLAALTGAHRDAHFFFLWPARDDGMVEPLVARLIDILDGTKWMQARQPLRSEEHTSELQSLMRNSYAVFRLKK